MQLKKILLLLLFLTALAVIAYNFAARDPYPYNPESEMPSDNVPKAKIEALTTAEDLPELQFINANRELKSIFDFKNKVLIVNFWASWCLPCIKELPKLNNLKTHFKNKVEVIAISIDSSEFEEVKTFFDQMNVKSLDFYIDHNNLSYVASRSLGIPTTLIIDKNFKIHYRISGYVDWSQKTNMQLIENLLTSKRERNNKNQVN